LEATPFKLEGKIRDGVISNMDHHLVLILAKVLDWVILTGVAVKGQNCVLEKFTFQYILREGRVGCIIYVMVLNLP